MGESGLNDEAREGEAKKGVAHLNHENIMSMDRIYDFDLGLAVRKHA